jgi:pyruvate dehydrogenase E2 component (dihydrolipoamide acetyltransferase)
MSKIVVMPKLGLTMSEGKVAKWHKNVGDPVKKGDIILEVETDKLTNEVVADQDGIVREILVQEGESVPVAEPLAIISLEDEDISSLLIELQSGGIVSQKEDREEDTKAVPKTEREEGEYIRATPYAKKLAKERSVKLEKVQGTGEDGRILAKDVLGFEEEVKVKISPTAAKMAKEFGVDTSSIQADGRIMKEDILAAVQNGTQEDLVKRVPATSMRKIIAKRMLENWNTIPAVNFNIEADISRLKALRKSLKDPFLKEGVRLSYNHILMKILSNVLLEFPYLNASFDGEEIEIHHYINIGLAVAVEEGLLVPNIKNVQSKSLLDIAKEVERKIKDAREGSLSPDDLYGGTFTITNIGMYGIDSFTPIINKPEVAILGVNRMVEKPIVKDGEVVVRPMMQFSLTADHRLVDGAMAAQFLSRFKEVIENPYLLLM